MKNLGFSVYNIDKFKGINSFETLDEDNKLSEEEKLISFKNNYFIFKKDHNVDISEIMKIIFTKKTNRPKAVKIKRLKLVQMI